MGNKLINNMVFIPPVCTYSEKKPKQVIEIVTSSGKKIPAYYFESLGKATKTTIVYSHGNAADIGAMYEFLKLLHENLPVNILHYEYIGYGLAKEQGKPSESNTFESVEAAVNYLKTKKKIQESDIIMFGTSVGSGPTCHIVSKYQDLRGLVLECPFTSCCRVVVDSKGISGMLDRTVDMFINIAKIPKVKCPVIIFHGTEDSVVPFDHGVQLWDKVPSKYKYKNVWIRNADHHNIIEKLSPTVYIEYLNDFVEFCDKFLVENKDERKLRLKKSKKKKKKKRFASLFSCSSKSLETDSFDLMVDLDDPEESDEEEEKKGDKKDEKKDIKKDDDDDEEGEGEEEEETKKEEKKEDEKDD